MLIVFQTMLPIFLVCVLINVAVATLDLNDVPIQHKPLFVPSLTEIAQVLNKGLRKNYKEVQVEVVDCPDLRDPPFYMASFGLGGNTRLVQIGGFEYFAPYPNFTKVYDVLDVVKAVGLNNTAFVIGASAGPHDYVGMNCESICNMNVTDGKVDQQTRTININKDGSYTLDILPANETRVDILTDVFISEGKPGPVLKVYARHRIGKDAYAVSIRRTLGKYYGNRTVGLGGVFVQLKGQHEHVLLPEAPETPIITFKDLAEWLRQYNMTGPLISVGVIITGKYGLDFRLQHFHSFSHHGDGGHYNIDLGAEEAEHLGYFNVADLAYRIDKPPVLLV